MIDIELLRSNSQKVAEAARQKGARVDVDHILAVDGKRRSALRELEEMRSEHNTLSDSIASLAAAAREEAITRSKALKDRIGHKTFEWEALQAELADLMRAVPNLPLPEVPVGASEAENVVVREVGKKPDFTFEPKDHLELGTALGVIDLEAGAKVSGSGFYYLRNEGALLELALVQYALQFLRKKGFTLWTTPDLARERFYVGTGYAPKGPEAQTYEVKESNLGLIATAEVTLAGIHADELIDSARLPLKYAGYSHCFRQEAGAYGKYSKGLYRVHQFTKIEMFAYTKPEDSQEMHEELLSLEEELWQSLAIPYRVLEMCTGDLGAQAARKFDLEAWMPGRGDWGEVTSTSNTTDYQSRNLNIRYHSDRGNDFLHTLNGTAIATSRAIIAILENYQNEDGSVRIPAVLQSYMGGISEIQR